MFFNITNLSLFFFDLFRTLIIFVHNIISKNSFILIFINEVIIYIYIISLSIRYLPIWQKSFSKKSYEKQPKHRFTIQSFHDMPMMK